jgi:hypothetical protein
MSAAWNGVATLAGAFDGWSCEYRGFNTELSVSTTNALGQNMASYWGTTWSNITQ